MARILGIVGSARRWGNCDLLVRQALQGAQEEGVGSELLRLTDLRLDPCTGCMRCVIGGKPCPIDDDMAWLIDSIQEADGLVLAAPTYFLGPAAVIKLVLDRLLMVAGRADESAPAPRPAITLATAGLHNWRGVTLPYLNALVAAFGFRTIESATAVAAGPGEVLLDEELMADVMVAGRRVARGDMESSSVAANVCPVCRCDAFLLDGTQATCPICGLKAAIEEGDDGLLLRFDATRPTAHRWTPEALRNHMVDWVMATGPRYMAKRADIKILRRRYREMDINWIHPPSGSQG